ncbi:unnamed protein product [Vitrella brassicaformis CCMP3155]|uniref:Immediate early response 3-interacting protein 1 n=1 Tax=Vitrella brassicaformis (strain CCMP3155) TaxID=1169540 RepID=A0A0G4GK46_VITBC|nr:unnamed protein product [Vitrella brassicaformis CCMP3155]|eukprot:CEM30304.1 unnamed protein product [Vitrella brassicaformis CCMP3155]
MAFTLLHLLEAALFVANALAILHDKRFLAKYSLDKPAYGEGLKNQVAMLLYAVRTYLRMPLALCNVLVIVVELLLG